MGRRPYFFLIFCKEKALLTKFNPVKQKATTVGKRLSWEELTWNAKYSCCRELRSGSVKRCRPTHVFMASWFAIPSAGVKYALNTDSISEFYTTGSCIGFWILKRIPCYQTMWCGDCVTTMSIAWICCFQFSFHTDCSYIQGFGAIRCNIGDICLFVILYSGFAIERHFSFLHIEIKYSYQQDPFLNF